MKKHIGCIDTGVGREWDLPFDNYRYGINESILNLLVSKEKKYRPSKIAKICNRSLSSKSIDHHDEDFRNIWVSNTRWVLLNLDVLQCLQASETEIQIGEIKIKWLIFPWFYKGEYLYNKLDDVYETIMEKKDNRNIYTIAAFFLIMIVTINWFMDWNGRVSISLAKYLIDTFGDKKLSLMKLQESKDELAHYTAIAIILLMPKEVLVSAHDHITWEVNILASLKNDPQKIEDFLDSFSNAITSYVQNFSSNLSTGDEYIDQYIADLGKILEKSSM